MSPSLFDVAAVLWARPIRERAVAGEDVDGIPGHPQIRCCLRDFSAPLFPVPGRTWLTAELADFSRMGEKPASFRLRHPQKGIASSFAVMTYGDSLQIRRRGFTAGGIFTA